MKRGGLGCILNSNRAIDVRWLAELRKWSKEEEESWETNVYRAMRSCFLISGTMCGGNEEEEVREGTPVVLEIFGVQDFK